MDVQSILRDIHNTKQDKKIARLNKRLYEHFQKDPNKISFDFEERAIIELAYEEWLDYTEDIKNNYTKQMDVLKSRYESIRACDLYRNVLCNNGYIRPQNQILRLFIPILHTKIHCKPILSMEDDYKCF